MKYPHYTHWQLGKLSEFPPCCNAYFHCRSYFIRFPRLWKLIVKASRFISSKDFQHVACPLHLTAYHVGLYKPEYHDCEECGWQQLFKKECNLKPVHETRVRAIIEFEYLEQIRRDGRIWILYRSARISDEILDSLQNSTSAL